MAIDTWNNLPHNFLLKNMFVEKYLLTECLIKQIHIKAMNLFSTPVTSVIISKIANNMLETQW